MHPMAHIPMQDKDMICDSLASQKEITGIYNTFSNECVSTPLRNELLNILHDEHSIGADILSEMQKRGWYPAEQAEEQNIVNALNGAYNGLGLGIDAITGKHPERITGFSVQGLLLPGYPSGSRRPFYSTFDRFLNKKAVY